MWELAWALQNSTAPSSAQVERSGHTVVERLQKQDPVLKQIKVQFVIQQRPEPTPLGALVHSPQQCTIVINTTPQAWQQWHRLLKNLPIANHKAALEAAMAHELGHCIAPNVNKQTINSNIRARADEAPDANNAPTEELFADIVAMLYTKQHNPEHFEAVAQAFLLARKQHAKLEPSHNTFAALNHAVRIQTSQLEKKWDESQFNNNIAEKTASLLRISQNAAALETTTE